MGLILHKIKPISATRASIYSVYQSSPLGVQVIYEYLPDLLKLLFFDATLKIESKNMIQ